MKVRISYTVDVSDEFRRALNHRYGKPGLATREEVREHYRTHGGTVDDDVMSDWQDEADEGGESHDEDA